MLQAIKQLGQFSVLLVCFFGGAVFAESIPQLSTLTPVAPQQPSMFRVDRIEVEQGAELLTIFAQKRGDREIPLISVLRDTLGDRNPDNDRLRYVWSWPYTPPSWKQRLTASIPFFYRRSGASRSSENKKLRPLIDLANPDRGLVQDLLSQALQSMVLDRNGLLVRASSRSYRGNSTDSGQLHTLQAFTVMSEAQSQSATDRLFSDAEVEQICARLSLNRNTLGMLVSDGRLRGVYRKQRFTEEVSRGANWDLLRQAAERNGLIFEPLSFGDRRPSHALLWIERSANGHQPARAFDSAFLGISNPWVDTRLPDWKGYIATRYFDAENRQVSAATPGAHPVELIPLALYSLEHPRVPLLLVDFRDGSRPKRWEMARRAASDTATGVLGLTGFANWEYHAIQMGWTFVRGRHGSPVDRYSRLGAYTELRQLLALDSRIDPEFRSEIAKRLDRLALNPMDTNSEAESQIARRNYSLLMSKAGTGALLGNRLHRDRQSELARDLHSRFTRFLFGSATAVTFGQYHHRDVPGYSLLSQLDIHRRAASQSSFLRALVAGGVRPEVAWAPALVTRSIAQLADPRMAALEKDIPTLVERLFVQSQDDSIRRQCLKTLHGIDTVNARDILARVANNKQIEGAWRDLAVQYLRGTVEQSYALPAAAMNSGCE